MMENDPQNLSDTHNESKIITLYINPENNTLNFVKSAPQLWK